MNKECQECPLCQTRIQVVDAKGSKTPRIMFVGEAPGPEENKKGIPFVGRSGFLLDKWIAILGLKKDEYCVTNTVKCFPNDNGRIRAPSTDEIETCRHWLEEEIKEKNPEIIVTLGKTAMQWFFPAKEKITHESGKHYDWKDRKVYIFLHPSYFLRNAHANWKAMINSLYKDLHDGKGLDLEQNSKLVYDLETSSLNPVTGKIRRSGFYSFKDKNVHIIYPKDVMKGQQLLLGHEVLIGFNNKAFDDEYLKAKNIKFAPTVNIDLKRVAEKRASIIKKPIIGFSLNSVCEALGLGQKLEFDYELLQKEPEECTPEQNKMIDDYLTQDVLLHKALYDWFETEFAPLKEYLSDADNAFFNHITLDPSAYAYKVICRLAGLEEKYDQEAEREEIKGGFVVEPKVEKKVGVIWLLDFKSAYPHAHMMQNLFSKVAPEEKGYNGNELYSLRGTYKTDKMGKIERILQMLYKKRKEFKEANDPREYAIKIIINIFYGISGNPKFVSVYDIDTANDCTKTVREWLSYAEKIFEEDGYEILYGDTDSKFIYDPYNDKERILKTKDKIIKHIKSIVPFPQDTFDMGIDDKIKAIFFFKDEKGEREKKKNYMYINDNDKIIIKGLSIIKLTATQLSNSIFDDLKPEIIKNLDCKFRKDLIDARIRKKVKEEGIEITTRNFRILDGKVYKSKTSIQYQILQKLGYGNHKLIKNKRIGIGKGVKYCTLKEAEEVNLTFEDLDLKNVWNELSPFIKVVKMKNLFSKW